ncbi:MAG: hypothetical protein R6X02_19665 [Enhygromyxa sp.]
MPGMSPPEPRSAPEFFYRFEADLQVSPIGLTPEGLRFVSAFEGTIREGFMQGARVWGIDQYLLRSDGVGILDAPKTLSLGDTHLLEYVRGYCLPPKGLALPPLAKLLEPDFEWPDLDFPLHGFSLFRAGASLQRLNRALGQIEGWANYRAGTLDVTTYLLAP